MKHACSIVVFCALAATAFAAESKVTLESLPQAVQDGIKRETGGVPISSISKDRERGKVEYEVETTANGKPRSYTFDTKGNLLEQEDAVELDSVPPAAKVALQKKADGGSIQEIEQVTSHGTVLYEAEVTTAAGKKIEVAVTASGDVKTSHPADKD